MNSALSIVGFSFVSQHTPRAVTADPPSLVMLPPLVADVEVTEDTCVVVSEGTWAGVVNVTGFPYPVPICCCSP